MVKSFNVRKQTAIERLQLEAIVTGTNESNIMGAEIEYHVCMVVVKHILPTRILSYITKERVIEILLQLVMAPPNSSTRGQHQMQW